MIKSLQYLLILLCLPAGMTNAADAASADSTAEKKGSGLTDTVRYESDEIGYDAQEKILTLIGKAKVQYQTMVLRADTIVYTMGDDLFTATGKPVLIEGSDTTVGEHMSYNIKTRRGSVRHASTYLTDAFLTGQRIMKSRENNLYVHQGEYTTCALIDTPHYFFYGENIRIIPNDKIVSRPVVLNIGGAPVFALPYFIFPVERNRKSGILTPAWGGNPSGGGYVDNVGYYWTPNDYFDLSVAGRIREFSEFMAKASSRYALKYRLSGNVAGRYVFNSDFLKSSREWALDYSHNQNITPDGKTTLSGRGNLVSTKNFYADFSQESDEIREQLLTANLSLNRQFESIKGNGSVVLNRSQNLAKNHTVDDLPSLSFSLFDRPLIPTADDEGIMGGGEKDSVATRWYNNIYWGYSGRGIVRRDVYGDEEEGFIRPGASNEIHFSAPQKVFKYLTVSPRFSASMASFYGYIDTTVRGYDTTFDTTVFQTNDLADTARFTNHSMTILATEVVPSGDSTDTVYTVQEVGNMPRITPRRDTIGGSFANVGNWDAGVNMSTNLYGLYPLRFFGFAGMRHTLSPSVSYTFKPKHDLDKMFFPVGIGAQGAHERQQNLNLSVRNLFEGKVVGKADSGGGKPKEKKFTLLQTDLSAAYNFEAEGPKWSDLSLSASTGYRFLGVRYNSSFWLYDQSQSISLPILRSYNYSLSTGSFEMRGKLWDGDLLLLDSLRTPHHIRDYSAGPQDWRVSITPAYSYSASRAKQTDVFIPNKTYNLGASADIGFTRSWRVSWSGNYNFILNQMVQNAITLVCDAECWQMRLQWRPERLNPGYYFVINIKKIPEIKWEQRDRY